MVEIRRARFADKPRIKALMEDALSRSSYAGTQIEDRRADPVMSQCIGMSGQARPGNICTFIAEEQDRIEACLIGTIVPLYECLGINLATDLLWYARSDASARSGIGVLRAFHQWAGDCPGSVIIRHGITDAIADPARTAKALERVGFRQSGVIYQKEITK